jgi:hypothetical protein
LERQSQKFQGVMGRSAVFRLSVVKEGIRLVCRDIGEWEQELERAARLSLMEKDMGKNVYYWVTPLLREEIFDSLSEEVQEMCPGLLRSTTRGCCPLLRIMSLCMLLN